MAMLIQDIHAKKIAGLSTPEIRRKGIRSGFKMIDLASREETVVHRNYVSRYRSLGRVFVVTRNNLEDVRNSILNELTDAP